MLQYLHIVAFTKFYCDTLFVIKLTKIAETWQISFVFYYHYFYLSHDKSNKRQKWLDNTKLKRDEGFLSGISFFQNESRKECCDAGFAMLSKFVEMPGLGQNGILDVSWLYFTEYSTCVEPRLLSLEARLLTMLNTLASAGFLYDGRLSHSCALWGSLVNFLTTTSIDSEIHTRIFFTTRILSRK